MKNIVNWIKYYLFFVLFPLDLISIIIFVIVWVVTFERSKMYDAYGNFDREGVVKDAFDYLISKKPIMKHLRIIYLLIILALFCL